MFALDIETDAIRDRCQGQLIFPGKKFIRAMEEKELLHAKALSPSDAAEGDILIYYRNGAPEHAGILTSNRVISKWGSGPTHIWEHGIYEVPESYGDEVRVFRPRRDTVKLYRAWASSYGI
ncbi:MAG: hypothetical protein ACLQJR_00370 [Stellaceae bacterium]